MRASKAFGIKASLLLSSFDDLRSLDGDIILTLPRVYLMNAHEA